MYNQRSGKKKKRKKKIAVRYFDKQFHIYHQHVNKNKINNNNKKKKVSDNNFVFL